MTRLIHRSERDRLLAAAGLEPSDVALFHLARRIAEHVKATGLAGVDTSDPDERAALVSAVGGADVDALIKATKLAVAAGTLVALP
jgi:hypothetical protein